MEQMAAIVKHDQPTEWVNSMITPTKANGKICVSIDPRDLNQAIKREHEKLFSKLNATSGYWAIKLDEKSSRLCTFKSMPFGIKLCIKEK